MTTSVTDDRQAFEAWATSKGMEISMCPEFPGEYDWAGVQGHWETWQAALRSQGNVEGWRPIETAPKDGSVFLGYEGGVVAQIMWNGWKGQRQYWVITGYCWGDESNDADPTHWMPLPTGPNDLTAIIGEGD